MKKKRDRISGKDNVILFPDLEKRLIDKGLDHLQNKRFREAITYLTQAEQLLPENEEVIIGLILANFEVGNLQIAKQYAKEMLNKGLGDYYQIVDIYIMILVQQHQYQEIISTIEALLEGREVPPEKHEQFSKILQFSKRMLNEQADYDENHEEESSPTLLNLYSYQEPGEQIQLASQLSERNIRHFLDEITEYLQSETGDAFFKSLLLNILKDQDIDKEVIVTKFGKSYTVIPNQLTDFQTNPSFLLITEHITMMLEQDNPMLLEAALQLITRFAIAYFPFTLQPEQPALWAGAFHFVAQGYFGLEEKAETIAEMYTINPNELATAIAFISKIEENSSP